MMQGLLQSLEATRLLLLHRVQRSYVQPRQEIEFPEGLLFALLNIISKLNQCLWFLFHLLNILWRFRLHFLPESKRIESRRHLKMFVIELECSTSARLELSARLLDMSQKDPVVFFGYCKNLSYVVKSC